MADTEDMADTATAVTVAAETASVTRILRKPHPHLGWENPMTANHDN